uniref:Uncharacterized protein n=1 Tax=Amphimedon queenslandica TaxID=400682 RepID=A0A1X7UJY0_AMPQE
MDHLLNGTFTLVEIIRWDVTVAKETYLKDKRRTLPQIVKCSKQKTSSFKLGVLYQPFIKLILSRLYQMNYV